MGWETGTKREFKFDPNSTENEGRFRLFDPKKVDKDSYFRRRSSMPGVSYVMGKAGGETVIQAVRFNKEDYTEDGASRWWKDNHGRGGLVFSDERKKKAMNRLDRIASKVADKTAAALSWMMPEIEQETGMYESVNDAVEVTGDRGYAHGGTGIWYMKPEFFRDGVGGYDWLVKNGIVPTGQSVVLTHRMLGRISERNPDAVYRMMQGENWSPDGQARNLIRKRGLQHTSMSVGDVIQFGSEFLLVDAAGFKKLS